MTFHQTILQQIRQGDPWCLPAVGAREFVYSSEHRYLTFRVTIKRGQTHWIRVTLTPLDEYTVDLIKLPRKSKNNPSPSPEIERQVDHVHAPELAHVIYNICNR